MISAITLAPPPDAEWYRWDRIVPEGLIRPWLATIAGGGSGGMSARPRPVAGAFLGGWLADCVVSAAIGAIVLHGRVHDVGPANLLIHRHPDGWFDDVAVRSPTMAVLPGDELAGRSGIEVVPDRPALRQWFADRAVRSLAPVLSEVRSASRYGLRGLWGATADLLCSAALEAAQEAEPSPEPQWALLEAHAVLDIMSLQAPALTVRPTQETRPPQEIRLRKGTCCLYFRTCEAIAQERVGGSRFCQACPYAPTKA